MAGKAKLASSTTAKVRALIARFNAVHGEGMRALQRKDFAALGKAINEEQDISAEQGAMVLEQHATLAERRERVPSLRPKPKSPKR